MMTSWPMFKPAFVNQIMYWFMQCPLSWPLVQKKATGEHIKTFPKMPQAPQAVTMHSMT
jgi:hypothetical protein